MLRALLPLSAAAAASPVVFNGHTVLRVDAPSEEVVRRVHAAFIADEARAMELKLDFWQEPAVVGLPIDIRVPPETLAETRKALATLGLNVSTLIEDLQPALDAMVANRTGYKSGAAINYEEYHTYEEIDQWITDIAAEHSNIVEVVNIGTSYEGRAMRALKITGPQQRGRDKPKIWSNHGIHAREWLSPSTCLWIVRELVTGYGNDAEVTRLVNDIEWYILPQTNPDGYAFTWSSNRMWRKTRAPTTDPSCIGTDPNRNWEYQWGGGGSSNNPCSDTYRGAAPFSEVETRAVGHFVRDNGFRGAIDMHCCGAMWMTPWGYTTAYPDDYAEQDAVSARVNAAIHGANGVNYRHGTIARVIYVASGSTADYWYHTAHTLHSVAIEMQGSFTSPASQIKPRGEELWAGYKAFGEAIIASPGKGPRNGAA